MSELFSWSKWLGGFLDPTRFLKDAGTLLRLVIILGICLLCYLGLVEVRKIFVKPISPPTSTVTGMSGGTIENSGSKSSVNKFGLLNL